MYKKKYLKYKTKYLNQKITQQGGDNNVFDLDNEYDFNDNVQKNISLIHKIFGESFFIKKGSITMPAILRKIKGYFNDMYFYELSYDEPERTYIQAPFLIWFYDVKTMELNNNTFIEFIHNTKKHTGSQIMQMILDIQKKLGVHKTILHDGTTIECHNEKISLSYFKMIEKGLTYYMRFGFVPEPLQHYTCEIPFNNKEEWYDKVNTILDKIKKIKINDIIEKYNKVLILINDVREKKDYQNCKMKYLVFPSLKPYHYYYEENVQGELDRLEKGANEIISILSDTNESYLQPLLIKLFNDKNLCAKYATLNKYIMTSRILELKYNDDIIIFDYIVPFKLLNVAISGIHFAYYFKSKQIGGRSDHYVKTLTDNDYELILDIDPIMREIVVNNHLNLFDILKNTKYYFYYNNNDELVSHVYVQQPNTNGIHPVLKEPMNGMYYVWGVETIAPFLRKGYAYELLSHIFKDNEAYFLRVDKNNIPAINLYKKLGFEYYKDVNDNNQIMTRK